MALLATCVEHAGIVRIFFDVRPADPIPQEERRIAMVIEHALALAQEDAEAKRLRHAA